MKAKVDKDILKEKWWLIVGPALFVLLSVLVLILPDKPIYYASLQTKEVTVKTFKHHYGTHGASYHDIRTTDGERYVIKGEYRREQLEELLTKGTKITIKWYKNKPFGALCAEEIYVNNEKVVTYNNDLPINTKIPLIVGVCGIVLGLGSLYSVRLILIATTEQKRRNEKTKRTYRKTKK